MTNCLKKSKAFAKMVLRPTDEGAAKEVILKSNGSYHWSLFSSAAQIPRHFKLIRSGLTLIVVFYLLLLPQNVHGQNASIKASVNKNNFSTDELVILTVTVIDDSPQQPRPLLPRLDGLAVIDLDLTTNVTNVNGTLYTEAVFTYHLQPRRTGVLTIPSIAVEITDQRLETQPISIEVSQGQAPLPTTGNEVNPDDITPPANLKGQDFFIETQVDTQRPYINQQIIHTFRFYQAIQLYKEPQYDEPLFTGFERAGLPVRQYNLDVDGRTYLITEIRTLLFPKNVGKLTIRPARLVLLGNFYEDPVEMYTEALTVEVQALPGNAPPGFNGAVGQYEIKAWFSPKVAVINQPSTFYVAVSGAGNINLLPEPTWPQLSWWRAYDTLTSLTTDITEDKLMTGTRVFERLVVPGQVGNHTIPPASLVYFDPIVAEYRTITTDPIPVEIIPAPTPAPATPTVVMVTPTSTPASLAQANAPTSNEAEPDAANEVNPVLLDSNAFRLRFVQLPLLTFLLLGMCGMIPLAAAAGAGGLWWWQRRQQRYMPVTNPQAVDTLQQPSQHIHPALAAAMGQSSDNYKTVQHVLNSYFENLLKKPVNGMTRTELLDQLRQYGLEPALIEDIKNCLTQCDLERYGPAIKDAGWALMATTDELLFKLDEATK